MAMSSEANSISISDSIWNVAGLTHIVEAEVIFLLPLLL
jgi:hypothetical protein